MDSLTRILLNPEDTAHEARAFIEALLPESAGATLITLSGELGAGKTAFTQGVANALGITDTVNSPTFVVEKIYNIPSDESATPSRFARLVHIDAYRLQDISDLNALGFGAMMSNPGTLIIVEWPEKVVGLAEQAAVKILLEHLPDGSRQITYA